MGPGRAHPPPPTLCRISSPSNTPTLRITATLLTCTRPPPLNVACLPSLPPIHVARQVGLPSPSHRPPPVSRLHPPPLHHRCPTLMGPLQRTHRLGDVRDVAGAVRAALLQDVWHVLVLPSRRGGGGGGTCGCTLGGGGRAGDLVAAASQQGPPVWLEKLPQACCSQAKQRGPPAGASINLPHSPPHPAAWVARRMGAPSGTVPHPRLEPPPTTLQPAHHPPTRPPIAFTYFGSLGSQGQYFWQCPPPYLRQPRLRLKKSVSPGFRDGQMRRLGPLTTHR
jgi:hypothetical protein